MSYEQFIAELNKGYKVTGPQELDGLALQNYSFASDTRSRGLKFIESMEKEIGFDFKPARILDVGCAYGGFCIEAAKRGATAYGIDINPRLLELARINAQDEEVGGKIHFLKMDATATDMTELLPRDFDLVVVNDVFEHVYDTARLLSNLSLITADNAALYFMIPNGLCTQSICSEVHRWVPGVSILDPSYWHYRITQPFSIYYRRWDYYAALLSYYGFSDIRLFNLCGRFNEDRAQLIEHLGLELAKVKKTVLADLEHEDSAVQPYREALLTRVGDVEKEMQSDLNSLSNVELSWKYLTAAWEGIAVKRVDSTAATGQSGVMCAALKDKVDKLRKEGDKLRRREDRLQAQLKVVGNSLSYRLGNALVQAVAAPGRNTVLLPYRLIRLCGEQFRRWRAPANR